MGGMAADDDDGALAALLAQYPPDVIEQWVAGLDAVDVTVVERALAAAGAAGWRANPAVMAAHLTKQRFHVWPYVAFLAERFAAMVRGDGPKRQIWNMPARYGKTMLASRWGPVWAFDLAPAANTILTSYGDALAMENAVFVRDQLAAFPDVLRCQLRPDRRRADRFVTSAGGGLLAAGMHSAISGFGAGDGGGIIIDDPFKNWQDAHSPAMRRAVWEQYRSVLRLRLDSDDAFILCVHTRWHPEDLTGMLLKGSEDETGEAWDVVRIPALAEAHDPASADLLSRLPDPLGRQPGEPIEPRRFPVAAVKARAVALGSYLAGALEQQRPTPEEGDELKRGWWQWYKVLPRVDTYVTSWDFKLKDKQSGDYVVGQVWARAGASVFLVDQLRGQWPQAVTRAGLALLAVRYPRVAAHLCENTGYGPEVMEQLRKADPGYALRPDVAAMLGVRPDEVAGVEAVIRRGMERLVPVKVTGDKQARVRAVAPMVEAGNVWLPERAGFALALVDECAAFPNGAHDDMVDAMSQALARIAKYDSAVWADAAPSVRLDGQGRPQQVHGVRRPGDAHRLPSVPGRATGVRTRPQQWR